VIPPDIIAPPGAAFLVTWARRLAVAREHTAAAERARTSVLGRSRMGRLLGGSSQVDAGAASRRCKLAGPGGGLKGLPSPRRAWKGGAGRAGRLCRRPFDFAGAARVQTPGSVPA